MDFWRVVAAVALLVAVSAQGTEKPKVYRLHVLSEIRNRYAKTLITSKVGNLASHAQEISFDAVLPENAFISRFVIEMDGVAYEAYVRGKEEAKREYDAAVASGRGAAHVAVSARDSNVVHVSVNVEPEKKVTFNLTYEELLQRDSAYNLRININPRQLVDDLAVEVRIEEKIPLGLVNVPTLQLSNEITDTPDNTTDPLAVIERPTPKSAIVRWAPTREQQQSRAEEGLSGQLVVRYDVDRVANPSQILVSEDGYFVHFYAPPGLPPLPKHVVFVLDVSGSMRGRKIEQLKTAMNTILDELNPSDVFSLIPFSSDVQVWHPDVPLTFEYRWEKSQQPQFNSSAIVEATRENIDKAKNSINSFEAFGATYMFSALITALQVADAGAASGGGGSAPGHRRHAPMLVLLTDGEPNGDVSDTDEIVRRVTSRNADSGAAIFTLAFGVGADYSFLRRLALRNSGIGRKIYEAADAHLQLRDFYRRIASPLLADVNFHYNAQQVEEESLTTVKFPTLFGGGELVVAGRLSSWVGQPWCAVTSRDANATYAVPAPAAVNVTSAERLWAYLTVRQLLDQDTATPNQTVRAKAKDIALRYSFVTPVTSLVVVKPNATTAVNLDESDAVQEDSVPLAMFGPAPRAPNRVYSMQALPYSPPLQTQLSFALAASASFDRADFRSKDHSFALAGSTGRQTPDLIGLGYLIALGDITWLGQWQTGGVTLNINGTDQHFLVDARPTEAGFQNCTAPTDLPGVCRHLATCVQDAFKTNLDVFLSGYLCVITGGYLGVCCPNNTTLTR